MAKLLCFVFLCFSFNVVFCQFGFLNQQTEAQRYGRYQSNGKGGFNFIPNMVRRLTGIFQVSPERVSQPRRNFVFPTETYRDSYDNRPIENRYDDRPVFTGQYIPSINLEPPLDMMYDNGETWGYEFPAAPAPSVNAQSDFSSNNREDIPVFKENDSSKPYSNNHQEITTEKQIIYSETDFVSPSLPANYQQNSSENSRESPDESSAVVFEDSKMVREEISLPDSLPSEESSSTTTLQELTPVPNFEGRSNGNFAGFQGSCETVDGNFGTCTAIANCGEYVALLKKAASDPAVVQLLRKAHCGFEANTPKVCCPKAGFPINPPSLTTTTTEPAPVVTEPPVTPETPPKTPVDGPLFPSPPECGFSNASFSRVVGGVPAKLGDFPWMALLGYKPRRGSDPRWLCGGSLITAQHVLTAAHCIQGHEDDLYLVRLGELDLDRDDEGATPVDVPIKEKLKHEEYDPTSFTNDIGLLLLSRQVQFTSLIRPICIPTDSELRARSFENYTPIIAGWGDTEFRGPSASHLQALQLPVVSNEFCKQAYARYKAQTIDQRVLCAGYKQGGRDACQGDSGGPLMQPIWNRKTFQTFFYQIGVVSYGRKCAEAGFPGVYSRTTHFVPWIEKTAKASVNR